MRTTVEQSIKPALAAVAEALGQGPLADMDPQIEPTRDPSHGDFTSNIAMRAAQVVGLPPRKLAQLIVDKIPPHPSIEKIEIAGPGFINAYLANAAWHAETASVLTSGAAYGKSDQGRGQRVLIEFVSANPTGPLHVGHGRHAAFGDCIANLLRATGHEVDTEYYVNDAGRQMDILALSVWLRYIAMTGADFSFPENCYQGEYCKTIAQTIEADHKAELTGNIDALMNLLADSSLEPEPKLDALITLAKTELGAEQFAIFFTAAIDSILGDIRNDLSEFGVEYDKWYSEKSLTDRDAINRAIEKLQNKGLLYKQDGALWFRTTDFGDDKDRVVIRDNGATTYFASDIAYHREKIERGYDQLINVLGSDHHGYIPRLRAALTGLDKPADALDVQLVQFVVLFRGNEKVQMTTRGGKYVSLRELREEVGQDAARFFYVSRSNDQHLDFDLELAKSQSNDNPVYYVQYAHARIASTLDRLVEQGYNIPSAKIYHLAALSTAEEIGLMREISRYPDAVTAAAQSRGPQILVQYLRSLASVFHSFYNAQRVLVEDQALRDSRVLLIQAVQQVLANGLGLLGVSAPKSM